MNDKKDAGVDQEYIRVLSHQLKSPINTIQSLLSTISEGYAGEVSALSRFPGVSCIVLCLYSKTN